MWYRRSGAGVYPLPILLPAFLLIASQLCFPKLGDRHVVVCVCVQTGGVCVQTGGVCVCSDWWCVCVQTSGVYDGLSLNPAFR